MRASLLKLFPDAFIRRLRNVDPVHLFWTLVLAFGVERGPSSTPEGTSLRDPARLSRREVGFDPDNPVLAL
ncbi:MAG: hypothetical protein ACREXS_06260 [Gammaproteobacteria bacterium]